MGYHVGLLAAEMEKASMQPVSSAAILTVPLAYFAFIDQIHLWLLTPHHLHDKISRSTEIPPVAFFSSHLYRSISHNQMITAIHCPPSNQSKRYH
jgi:hypothetical protein